MPSVSSLRLSLTIPSRMLQIPENKYKFALSHVNLVKSISFFSAEDEEEEEGTVIVESDDTLPPAATSISKTEHSKSYALKLSRINKHLAGQWGCRVFDENPWDDQERPFFKCEASDEEKHKKSSEDEEMELNGILTDRRIAEGLSYLDRSPETLEFVLCKCVLTNDFLKDLTALQYYHYMQYLDISHNEIQNLEPLGQLPFLMYLDASFNALTKVLDFKAPFYLTFVNLSHNFIKEINDLTDFWSLVHLNLSHNHITHISGLENLHHLRELNLSFNQIATLENLTNLKIQILDLRHNKVHKFDEREETGISTLYYLKELCLGKNYFYSLSMLKDLRSIQIIDVEDNDITSLIEIAHLKNLYYLTDLNLKGNAVTQHKNYVDVCLDNCSNLFRLDGQTISAEAKVNAKRSFKHTTFDANKRASQHFFMSLINDSPVGRTTIACNVSPIQLIILVGPPGCQKGVLTDVCCEIYPEWTTRGVCHTTRPRTQGEVDGKQYYFVSVDEFKDLLKTGEFYSSSEYFGYMYGFARSELGRVTNKKTIMVTHLDLDGALIMRERGFRPVLVLTMPRSEEMHRKYLSRKYYCQSKEPGVIEVGLSINKVQEINEKRKLLERHLLERDVKALLDEIIDEVTTRVSFFPKSEVKVFERRHSNTPQRLSVCFSGDVQYFQEDRRKRKRRLSFTKKVFETESSESQLTFNGNTSDESVKQRSPSYMIRELAEEQRCSIFYLDEVIELREKYLEMHWSNPGLFNYVLFTDYLDESLESLRDILKFSIETHHLRGPIADWKQDPSYEKMVKHRTEMLQNILTKNLDKTNKKRGCCKQFLNIHDI